MSKNASLSVQMLSVFFSVLILVLHLALITAIHNLPVYENDASAAVKQMAY